MNTSELLRIFRYILHELSRRQTYKQTALRRGMNIHMHSILTEKDAFFFTQSHLGCRDQLPRCIAANYNMTVWILAGSGINFS